MTPTPGIRIPPTEIASSGDVPNEAYLVEAFGRAAGVAVREKGGFRFFAATRPFYRLDRRLFRRLAALRAAVNGLIAAERARRAPFPRFVS
jgi:hypothetical protein